MKLAKFLSIILFAFMILLTGCSEDEAAKGKKDEKAGEQQEEPDKSNIPKAATEPEAMVKEGPGEAFTSEKMGPEKLKKTVGSLPEDLTADEAYNHLIHLLAADYSKVLKKYKNFNPSFIVDGAPKQGKGSDKKEENKKLHVALLMDASGSMGAYVNGEMKMKAAKESLQKFVSDLPKDAKVMLRVYGHKGTGSDADKKKSCSSTEVVYPLSTYKKAKFNKSLSKFKPAGWTPLAASIKAAKKDLKGYSGKNVKNVVYIISDGEETCGGNPVNAAKTLHDSGIATAVNIIGFDVGNKAQAQLKKVAKAGGGSFTNVDSGKDIFVAAQNNIQEAVEAAELNMWSAMEGVDLTWDAIHKNDDLDAIASDFDDVISQEKDFLLSGLIGLVETKKITEKEADKVEELIESREEKLDQLNEKKEEQLKKRIEGEKQKASDLIDKMKKERSKN
ncbi:vWA domain-containing protein [Virgibacillus siamensis]|uniref:vWA domain-containing protein n=1 Tax=Virgibacillus siamensis TaxID=480071 RepID=UPI0009844E0F|nr:VWA domain-containing protein [Virgibacillus siamensis]